MENKEITFTLTNGYVKTTTTSAGGSISSKDISLEDFGKIVQKFTVQESDWLPSEYGLQKFHIGKNHNTYLIVTPAKLLSVVYGEKYNIFTPVLAWFLKFRNNGKGREMSYSQSQLWALKSPIFTTKEQLYRAPFSNVWPDGRICWGQEEGKLKFPTEKSLQGIPDRFFAATANSDLDESRFRTFTSKYGSKPEMFKANHLFKEMDKRLTEDISFEENQKWLRDKVLRDGGTTIDSKWNEFKSN